MGIKTASFPHLGLYGDVFILNDKNGNRTLFEDHSALKKKQEKYEKWQAENAKMIQERLQKPDKEQGESIVSFVDNVSPYKMESYEATVPVLLVPDKENEEEILTIPDNTPFRKKLQKRAKKEAESIVTFADDVAPSEMIELDPEEIVPQLLEPEEEEEIVVITDDIPFQS
jgi:hypothetical protein